MYFIYCEAIQSILKALVVGKPVSNALLAVFITLVDESLYATIGYPSDVNLKLFWMGTIESPVSIISTIQEVPIAVVPRASRVIEVALTNKIAGNPFDNTLKDT